MPNDAQVGPRQTIVAPRREFAALSAARDEALAERAAIAEIIQIVNSSPGDLAPVFDAIPEKAHSLCEVAYGGLAVYDGEHFRMVATRGYPEHVSEAVRRPFRGNIHHQELVCGERY
jgi:two-component system, NtrC family, sensor kinase